MTTKELAAGAAAPGFDLPSSEGGSVSLASLRGRRAVLYFYPKDDTPGCTVEAKDFRDLLAAFRAAKVEVFGVSRDSVAKHCKFRDKYGLTFPLLADEDGKACEAFGVWREKTLYGRTSMGIERSTFLLSATGVIERVWRKVRVAGHASEVLAAARGDGATPIAATASSAPAATPKPAGEKPAAKRPAAKKSEATATKAKPAAATTKKSEGAAAAKKPAAKAKVTPARGR